MRAAPAGERDHVRDFYLLAVVAPLMVLGPGSPTGSWAVRAPGGRACCSPGRRSRRPLALALPAPVSAVLGFVAGGSEGFLEVVWLTALQERIPQEFLSRLSSYDTLGSFVFMPIGSALAGPDADAAGVSATLLAMAACAVATALVLASLPALREVRRFEPGAAPA